MSPLHSLSALGLVTVLAAGGGLLGATAAQAAPVALDTTPTVQTVTVPASIDPTGAHDVSAALNAFLAGIPDDTVVAFPAGARYRAEDTVKLVDKHRVELDGNGATLVATTTGYRSRSQLLVVGGSDIIVRGLTVVGANPDPGKDGTYLSTLEGQHGIELDGPQRVLVEDDTVRDVYGDLVYVGRDLRKSAPTWMQSSRDVTVRDNTLTGSGRQGISVTQGSRVLITGNAIGDVRRTTFDLEPNGSSWRVEDVTISDNVVGDGRLNFLSSAGRGPVDDVAVLRNTVNRPMNVLVKNRLGESRANWQFVGNVGTRSWATTLGAAVVGYGIEGVRFRDNTLPFNAGRTMVGIKLDSASCGLDVGGNVLTNAIAESTGGTTPCADGTTVGPVTLPAPAEAPRPRL